MPVALITALTVAASVAGAVVNYTGQQKAAEATKNVAAESRRAEELRKQQMQLENQRRQREVVRQLQINRSRAAAASANQGASASSSAIGGQASITGQATNQIEQIRENTAIGSAIFDSNASMAGFRADAALAESQANFGKTLFTMAPQIGQIGGSIGGVGSSLFTQASENPWKTTVTRN